MSKWPSCKAKSVLRALKRMGWVEVRVRGSHRALKHPSGAEYSFAYHDADEIHPVAMMRIAKATGLQTIDL